MTKIDAILRDVAALTPIERLDLLDLLREAPRPAAGQASDEESVGQRGLESWTESTQGEDWSAYYPPGLPVIDFADLSRKNQSLTE